MLQLSIYRYFCRKIAQWYILQLYIANPKYLNIEIIKKGRASYINQDSLNKVLKFKGENPNTRAILLKHTCLKKYGVENPQQCEEIKEKTNKTIKEKYGVENISQLQEIKDWKATMFISKQELMNMEKKLN